jgi:hypothetical protein
MKDSKKSDILSSQFILSIGNNPLMNRDNFHKINYKVIDSSIGIYISKNSN